MSRKVITLTLEQIYSKAVENGLLGHESVYTYPIGNRTSQTNKRWLLLVEIGNNEEYELEVSIPDNFPEFEKLKQIIDSDYFDTLIFDSMAKEHLKQFFTELLDLFGDVDYSDSNPEVQSDEIKWPALESAIYELIAERANREN